MPILTIFTPAYNRGHTLPRTYASLRRQDCKDFIWLVVDDGSTDNTAELVKVWQAEETEFEIRYLYKENGGMHTAHNAAYANIDTERAVRFSDDGEPGGTAGMPMLQVLQREGLFNVVCVVTRYFGGILLGAGGLVRAYTKGAKIAVDAAGKSMKRVWTAVYVPCPYPFYERVKLEAAAFGGILRKTDFGAEVELELLFPEGQVSAFLEKLTDLSSGTVEGMETGQEYRAFPVETA